MSEDCSICDHLFSESPLRIKEFPLSTLFLQQDQFFPGYCVLESKRHICELFDLDFENRSTLIEEINLAAQLLFKTFKPDKINYAFLGNQVPHMHWHLVPRWKNDPAWPDSIWAMPHESLVLPEDEYKKLIRKIQENF
ncbi:MAG TPA: HIT family protein [Nitrospiria bacterium]|jgi:diadenosine tetraphosphate (Ap4A) HIT family hydrolase